MKLLFSFLLNPPTYHLELIRGMEQQRIKLVVANENTLGYIQPETPNSLCILHASILKGSTFSNTSGSVNLPQNHRLATKQDFDNFNVFMGSFQNSEMYEFADS